MKPLLFFSLVLCLAAPPSAFADEERRETRTAQRFEQTGPKPGQPAPDFSLQTIDGRTVHAAELWAKRPMLLMTGSYTCPVFRGHVQGFDGLVRKFGDQLIELPRSFAERTSISGGIDYAKGVIARAPYEAPRRTIDVSGDGTNNSGRDVGLARDEALAKGVTINGLVILSDRPMAWNPEHTNPPGGLAEYYRTNVIGGPGAFVLVAEDFNSFGQAIVKKLIAEIAEWRPAQAPRATPGG